MRRNNFLNELKPELVQALNNGTYPLVHPCFIKFNQRNHSLDIHSNDINTSSFKLNKERAKLSEQDYKISHLEHEKYTVFNESAFLRPRQKSLETGPEMVYNKKPRLRKEEALLTQQQNQIYDLAGRELKMVYFPTWKDDKKTKWVGGRSFNNYITPHQDYTAIENEHTMYIDGLEAIGDISRRPRKENWIGSTDFSSTVRSDNFSQKNWKKKQWNKSENTNNMKSVDFTSKQKIYKNSILNELQFLNSQLYRKLLFNENFQKEQNGLSTTIKNQLMIKFHQQF